MGWLVAEMTQSVFRKNQNHKSVEGKEMNWINPKGEKQKRNLIIIKAEIFMGTLFFQTTEGTWLYFKDPLNQGQNLLYQRDMFELDSVQYIFDQDTNPNMFTLVKFSNLTTAKIVNAGNNKYVNRKLGEKRNLVVQVEKKSKHVDRV